MSKQIATYLARWLIKRLRDVDPEILCLLKAELRDFNMRTKTWPLMAALKASIDAQREADIRFLGERSHHPRQGEQP